MARPSKLAQFSKSAKEILIKHDLSSLDEMVKLLKESLPRPDDPKLMMALVNAGWEPYTTEDGKQRMRPNWDRRFKCLAEMVKLEHPTLRATEVSGKVDHGITVTIQRFGNGNEAPLKVIDMPTIERKELTGGGNV